MNWYEGDIAQAVSASKQKGAIFVVYVEGEDENSEKLTQMINDEQVTQQLQSEYFVAIKLVNNTVPLDQFRQIYKQVSVPSVFFIGRSGVPLEIVTEPISTSDFLEKLKQILIKHGINITSTKDTGKPSENFIENEKGEAMKNNEIVCENDVCTIKPKEVPTTSKEPDVIVLEGKPSLTPEQKVERAKELVNKTREAKQAQEEENRKLKELERRKFGQDVKNFQRWQQESDLKELADERNKEKKEQQAARQRVLNQIAQDKAERAARFPTPSQSASQSPATPTIVQRAPVNTNTARLQFRLPDGSSHTHEFPSKHTLQDVHNFILASLNLPFTEYTLSTTFPRREFTAAENFKTLVELELTPNAVILILPLHGVVAANTNNWLITLIWSFIGPLLNFVDYLKSKIMGSVSPSSGTSTGHERKRTTDSTSSSSNPKKRIGETSVIRRQGNVHRLADKSDSDDDNNTWNGNSTQQM